MDQEEGWKEDSSVSPGLGPLSSRRREQTGESLSKADK